jgi:ribosome maturation factor RimP
MESSSVERRLRELLEPGILALGFRLVLVSVDREQSKWMVRLYLDTMDPASRSVNIEDCAKVSESSALLIDNDAPFEGAYTIEVSSRGINRLLGPKDDFKSYIGKRLVLRLEKGYFGKKEAQGTLIGVEGDRLTLHMGSTAQELDVPFFAIRRAHLVYDFDRNDFL